MKTRHKYSKHFLNILKKYFFNFYFQNIEENRVSKFSRKILSLLQNEGNNNYNFFQCAFSRFFKTHIDLSKVKTIMYAYIAILEIL